MSKTEEPQVCGTPSDVDGAATAPPWPTASQASEYTAVLRREALDRELDVARAAGRESAFRLRLALSLMTDAARHQYDRLLQERALYAATQAILPMHGEKFLVRNKLALFEALQWFPGIEVEGLVTDTQTLVGQPWAHVGHMRAIEEGVAIIRRQDSELFVSPGDWLVTDPTGVMIVVSESVFWSAFELFESRTDRSESKP